MIRVLEDNHEPFANKYVDTLVVDSINNKRYLYDCNGTWEDISPYVPTTETLSFGDTDAIDMEEVSGVVTATLNIDPTSCGVSITPNGLLADIKQIANADAVAGDMSESITKEVIGCTEVLSLSLSTDAGQILQFGTDNKLLAVSSGGGYVFNDTQSILLDETAGAVTATLNVDTTPVALAPTGTILIQNDADGQIETLAAPTCAGAGADVSTIALGQKASNTNNWGVVHTQDWLTVRAVSANTTLVPATDSVISIDASGGNRTVALVAPVNCERRDFWIKRSDNNANTVVSITAQAGSNIDGVISIGLAGAGAFGGNRGESAHIVWAGAALGWLVI